MSGIQLDEESIFEVASQIDSPKVREDYLLQVCGNNSALRERVRKLLEIHDQDKSFLERPPEEIAETIPSRQVSERPGDEIGPYKLLQRIGEGGFGVVYMAEQTKPIRRKVAIKIIKPGMDTREVIARFEAERQALAMMDHPNIAHVYDGGETDSGRPYFVMELVKGIPLTQFCNDQKLPTKERLLLFSTICNAIQHAHQKGVIHRDIKPANVMVTLHDGEPVPKVIDFGVSKAINQKLTERTLFTSYGQMVGTPQYMSPEQAEMSGLDVDTRSDIYSLGVLLYELLTGTTPLELEQLRKAGFLEMQRMIKEEEPPKPSTRVSGVSERVTTVAKQRGITPEALQRSLKGDLDWVVMKSLSKDRNRRYETATDLARDIERHLRKEPVIAGPPTAAYRVRKFVARNRSLVATAGVVAFALLLVVWVGGLGFIEINRIATRERIAREQRDQILRKYSDAILDKALNDAVAGKLDESMLAIADARTAGVPESLLGFLEAVAALFGGEIPRAIESLEGIVAEHPNDVRAWALLFNAYRHQGNLNGYAEAEKKVGDLLGSHVEFDDYDLLFVGYAQADTHVAQAEGQAKLRELVERRPSWGLARAMLAHALANIAVDQDDPQLIDEAKNHLAIAEAILRENPFVIAVGLYVLAVERVDASRRGRPAKEIEIAASQRAKSLAMLYPDYLYGRMVRARYFSAIDRPELALAEWTTALKHGGSTQVSSNELCLMLRLERYDDVRQRRFGMHWVYLLEGNADGVRSALDAPRKDPTNMLGSVWRSYTRKMIGEDHVAMENWKRMRSEWQIIPPWLQISLDLFTDNRGPEELLDQANQSGSRFWKGHTEFNVGAHFLANGQREQAIKHFDNCIDANVWSDGLNHLAIALRDKLRADPSWPACLRDNEQLDSRSEAVTNQ